MTPIDFLNKYDPELLKQTYLLAYRGSISHGTFVPSTDPNSIDDIDLIGFCLPPEDHYYGLKSFGSRGTKEIKQNEWDVVTYEHVKAFRLLAQGNPNILNVLFLDPQHYIKLTDAARMILENRSLFIGKHIYNRTMGYASGQLHRMTHGGFAGYQGEKRHKMFKKLGFDAKNASHLIRILRQGIELLQRGEMDVFRPDAEELLAIKRGEWGKDRIEAEANKLFKAAAEALAASKLPEGPDVDKINELAVNVAHRNRDEQMFESYLDGRKVIVEKCEYKGGPIPFEIIEGPDICLGDAERLGNLDILKS